MHSTAHTIALIMAALSASVIAWDCNNEQHQNWCPDYSIGPACFGPMSWGHCDRGCAESVHVADGTWCSGNGVILALGIPMSTPGSRNSAPPSVSYNPGAAPSVAPGPASSPAPNPSIATPTADSKAASNIANLLTAKPPPSSPKPPPPPTKTPDPPKASPSPDPPKSPAIKPNSPKAPEVKPDPPKPTPSPEPEETVRPGGCRSTLPDMRVKQTQGYAKCL
ncbi:hypothetical protein E2P81_ATG01798 [Venturia nashicola]|nr:hypothetical protein E2P81_ATG01798 [Venturia nashicola]